MNINDLTPAEIRNLARYLEELADEQELLEKLKRENEKLKQEQLILRTAIRLTSKYRN